MFEKLNRNDNEICRNLVNPKDFRSNTSTCTLLVADLYERVSPFARSKRLERVVGLERPRIRKRRKTRVERMGLAVREINRPRLN